MARTYQDRQWPDLSPPSNRIAVRRGSKAERSRAAGAQLFHVWVTAASDCVHEWPTQAWAVLGEKLDGLRYVSLFVG